MLVVSNNRGNFHLKFFRRFKDIAVFVVVSLILPHPVYCLDVAAVTHFHQLYDPISFSSCRSGPRAQASPERTTTGVA